MSISIDSASWSSALVNDFHCCRKAHDLNKQSAGLAGNTCSIVNLFLVVHRDQHKAPKPTQKMCLDTPERLEAKLRNSAKEAGAQDT